MRAGMVMMALCAIGWTAGCLDFQEQNDASDDGSTEETIDVAPDGPADVPPDSPPEVAETADDAAEELPDVPPDVPDIAAELPDVADVADVADAPDVADIAEELPDVADGADVADAPLETEAEVGDVPPEAADVPMDDGPDPMPEVDDTGGDDGGGPDADVDAGGPLVAVAQAHRMSGALPLGVVFTADGTTVGGLDPALGVRYHWDFGDGDGLSTWPTSGKLRETDVGAVVGHVFRQFGTFDVTLTATTADGQVDVQTLSIQVLPTAAVFSPLRTVCVSSQAPLTWDGCPINADHLDLTAEATDAIETMMQMYPGESIRILYQRDVGFDWTQTVILDHGAPVMIGAWGPGLGRPILNVTFGPGLEVVAPATDLRITELRVVASLSANNFIRGFGSLENVLIDRVSFENAVSPLNFYNNDDSAVVDGLIISESELSNVTGTPLLLTATTRSALIGNTSTNVITDQPLVRVRWYDQLHVGHNLFNGSSWTGGVERVLVFAGVPGYGGCSRLLQFSDNEVISGSQAIGTYVASNFATVANCHTQTVIERNYLHRFDALPPAIHTLLNVFSNGAVVRNNLFDLSNAYVGAGTGQDAGIPVPPDDIYFVGNSCYALDTSEAGSCIGIALDQFPTNVVAQNNLATGTFQGGGLIYDVNGVMDTCTACNVSVSQASSPYAATPPTSAADFDTLGNPLVDGAIPSPYLIDDFRGMCRAGNGNVGAYDSAAGACP